MRSLIAAILMPALLAGCATHADLVDERLSSQTVIYIELRASIDRFAIESSRLAQEKSQVAAVRDLAARFVGEHAAMDRQLLAAAETAEPAIPAFALVSHHYAMLERLRAAGVQFDPLYRDYQVAIHQEALNLDRQYAAAIGIAPLQGFARRAAAVSEAHLRQVEALPVPPTPQPVPAAAPTVPPSAPMPPVGTGERG